LPDNPGGVDDRALHEALERFLGRKCGRPVRVENLAPLAGGASREMFGFDLHDGDASGVRELVLRMDPPPGRMQSDRAEEYRLLEIADQAGVRVPVVRWLGEASEGLGARFIVMDRVRGEAIARRLLRDDEYAQTRKALPADLARELARIHAIDPEDARLATVRARAPAGNDVRRFARFEIGRYRTLLDAADQGWPRPALSFAERWLHERAPTARRAALVHGDFRIGNVMFDERGLTAVLDWELAHVGDAMEDLGWLAVRAWRFGRDDLPAGGLCSREELWSAYEREAGASIDRSSALWWEVFGNWKWAIICVLQAASHKAGRYPNVELASLGRRVAEVEWELISLLEQVDARSA
jgi:aminoglycoside phosphotransferase (APT) family kinase protein